MKKTIYIILFTLLGFSVQLSLHAILEFLYIKLLLGDFELFGFVFSWENWFLVHRVFTMIFLFLGILIGFWQGVRWWSVLYDKNGKIKTKRRGLFFIKEK